MSLRWELRTTSDGVRIQCRTARGGQVDRRALRFSSTWLYLLKADEKTKMASFGSSGLPRHSVPMLQCWFLSGTTPERIHLAERWQGSWASWAEIFMNLNFMYISAGGFLSTFDDLKIELGLFRRIHLGCQSIKPHTSSCNAMELDVLLRPSLVERSGVSDLCLYKSHIIHRHIRLQNASCHDLSLVSRISCHLAEDVKSLLH